MEDKLVLKDGTEIIDGFASRASNDHLMLRIPGSNITEAVLNFTDPDKTETIECYCGVYKYTYTGYTDMYSVQYFSDENYVEVWLKALDGVKTTHSKETRVPEEYLPESMRTKEIEPFEEIQNGIEN